jgi:hypothetical protein
MRINDFDYHSLARAQVPSFVLETGTIGIAHVDGLDTAVTHNRNYRFLPLLLVIIQSITQLLGTWNDVL